MKLVIKFGSTFLILEFLFLSFAVVSNCEENWDMDIIGSFAWFYEIKIGDGRNDGINRLYASTFDGHLLEWTYNSKKIFRKWSMRVCGKIPGTVPVKKRMISVSIGPGKNDNLNRIYCANVNGNNYEFSYNKTNDKWAIDIIGRGSFQTGIIVGCSRNDGVNRIISSGANTPIDEFTWANKFWRLRRITNEKLFVWPVYIGQARNDGKNRIYCPDYVLSFIREYSWNGTSYDEIKIPSTKPFVKVITGQGRNDGIERVYAAEKDGHIIEFTYENNEWKSNDILNGKEHSHSRYGLCFGKIHNDRKNKLYSVAQNGALREHSFSGGKWIDIEIDAISGATANLTVGDARNDDINRVYIAGSNGKLYEYTLSE